MNLYAYFYLTYITYITYSTFSIHCSSKTSTILRKFWAGAADLLAAAARGGQLCAAERHRRDRGTAAERPMSGPRRGQRGRGWRWGGLTQRTMLKP